MSEDRFENLGKGGKKIGKNIARDVAGQIGLNVVPKGLNKQKQKAEHPAPRIQWSNALRKYFWSDGQKSEEEVTDGVERISNAEGFPLLLLPNILQGETLGQALAIAEDEMQRGQELEQHEPAPGKPQIIRRSVVSQLSQSSPLLSLVLPQLPKTLTACTEHEFEDASVVFYRRDTQDFYAEHHDSYAPDDPPRSRHRAYTVLLYLRSPPGPRSDGGTEFTSLTPADSSAGGGGGEEQEQRRAEGTGGRLIVKPSAGDALVWPNFDLDGRPCTLSQHCALQLSEEAEGGADNVGKAVLNLWFEGRVKQKSKLKPGKNLKTKAGPKRGRTGGSKIPAPRSGSDRALFPEFDASDRDTDGFSDSEGKSRARGFG